MKRILKLPFEYVFFFLQIFLIGLFALILIGYSMRVQEKDFFKNRMFSENVRGVLLSGGDGADLKLETEADFMLYKVVDESPFEIVRGVFGASDVFGFSGFIQTGRFFDQSDYENQTRTAVVGPDILSLAYEENGRLYYGYNRQMYEVIGVFHETGSSLDMAVYLNLGGLLQYESGMGRYFIDAKDAAAAGAALSALETGMEGKCGVETFPYRPPTAELAPETTALLWFSVLTAAFCLAVTAIFFVTRQKYTVSVQKLCGMTKRGLLWAYGAKIFAVVIVSFASACGSRGLCRTPLSACDFRKARPVHIMRGKIAVAM
jgi:hypothetical protein